MNRWMVAAVVVVAVSGSAHAVEYTWTGAGGDGRWGTKANWKPDTGIPGSGDDVVLPETNVNVTITLEADQAARSITFNPVNLFAYTLEGKSITLDDGGRIQFLKLAKGPPLGTKACQRVNSDIKLAGHASFGNSNSFFVDGESLYVMGTISGAGTITISSGDPRGYVRFEKENPEFTGEVIVESGWLDYRSPKSLGSGTQQVVVKGGQVRGLPGDRNFLVTADSHLPAAMSGTYTISNNATCTVKGEGASMKGVLQGAGSVIVIGPIMTGTAPHTLSGSFTIGAGQSTVLAKPAGVDAVSGPLKMNRNARLTWNADEQVSDRMPLTIDGDLAVLKLNGHRETLGTVDLQGDAVIECGDGANVLHAAGSSGVAWNPSKELVIVNWKGDAKGGGADQIAFGNDAEALTARQLAQIGFRNPAGYPAGLYRASLLASGEVVTDGRQILPIDPPFDVSEKARAERRKLYDVPGLADLSGTGTPLKKGMKISFYGDSITWNRSYVGAIEAALESGEATKDLGVTLINHGVNGGGVVQLRDGDEGKAHFGNTRPRPFAETLAEDKPDVVVVYIGINDVWWGKSTPAQFEKALTDLVTAAKANKVPMVLTTLGVWGDNPLKERPQNVKCDEYSEIVRKVAAANNVTLADLRKACVAYLMNHNGELQLNGSLRFAENGIISKDGVHLGATVPAAIIARGIYEALKEQRR